MESYHFTITTSSSTNKYPAKAHARRVAEKLGSKRGGVISLQGTASAYFSHSDQKQPFRQDRYFYYLSGCNEPDCSLTYDLDDDVLTLYLPPVDYTRFFYDGRGSTVEEALDKYDVDEARYADSLQQHGASRNRPWYTLSSHHGHSKTLSALPLQLALDACRSVKDEHEISLTRKANEISAAAHKDILLQLHKCKSEAEAEAVYMKRCLASLAKEQAYGPIFGAGTNASFLHYIDNDASFKDSQLLLVDAGCEWQHYASDVTRTIPLNRKDSGEWPSKEAKLLYEAVESIQEACVKLMKPGALFSSVNRRAVEQSFMALHSLGILKGDPMEAFASGVTRAFFPHGLGHHMGLEVHDVVPPPVNNDSIDLQQYRQAHRDLWHPRFGASEQAVILQEPVMEAGNVITVEPGLYFNKFFLETFVLPQEKYRKYIDLDVLKRYMPVGGVRIEDDILITRGGNENLTTAPKGAEMLKILKDAAKV